MIWKTSRLLVILKVDCITVYQLQRLEFLTFLQYRLLLFGINELASSSTVHIMLARFSCVCTFRHLIPLLLKTKFILFFGCWTAANMGMPNGEINERRENSKLRYSCQNPWTSSARSLPVFMLQRIADTALNYINPLWKASSNFPQPPTPLISSHSKAHCEETR